MKAMKMSRTILWTAAAVALVLAAQPAVAQTTVSECKVAINYVQADLDSVAIGGKNSQRTYDSLTSKLSGAKTKLDQTKFCDALQKLDDFDASIVKLAKVNRKGLSKMGQADADLLRTGATAAAACIESLDAFVPCD